MLHTALPPHAWTRSTAPQNAAEFWNVCTRPAARGGFGLTLGQTDRRLRVIERVIPVLPDSPAAYTAWRALVLAHGVLGVQAHDARLVAFMTAHGISHLLTLNQADFARFSAITAMSPAALVSAYP